MMFGEKLAAEGEGPGVGDPERLEPGEGCRSCGKAPGMCAGDELAMRME